MNTLTRQILGAVLASYLVIGIIFGTLVLLGVAEPVLGAYGPRSLAALLVGLVTSGAVLGYAMVFGGVPLGAFAWRFGRGDAGFLATMLASTVGLAAGAIWLSHVTGAREVVALPPRPELVALGLLGALGVVHEEVLARGYVLAVAQRRLGVGRALLLSAVVFALVHIPTRGVGPMLFSWLLGGLVYGYLYLKSGSLTVTVLAHALHNLAGDLFLYSGNGVALVQFAAPFDGWEKIGFKLVWSAALVGLTHWHYGRRQPWLAPAPELRKRWALLEASCSTPASETAQTETCYRLGDR